MRPEEAGAQRTRSNIVLVKAIAFRLPGANPFSWLIAIAAVSVSPAGGFVVAWTSNFGDENGDGVRSRLFDASGSPVGNDFVVNSYTTGTQYQGRVAHDEVGNFVISWMGPGDEFRITGTQGELIIERGINGRLLLCDQAHPDGEVLLTNNIAKLIRSLSLRERSGVHELSIAYEGYQLIQQHPGQP